MNTIEKLKEAKQLLDEGILNDDEYQKLKERLLNELDSEYSTETRSTAEPDEGMSLSKAEPIRATAPNEGASTGMKVLSFLFPIIGLILFLVDKDKKPVAARDELKWAGIGFGVGILLYIIVLAIGGCTAAAYFY